MISTTLSKSNSDKRRSSKGTALKAFTKTAAAAIFWIGIWFLAAVLINRELILPTPLTVLKRLGSLILTGDFWAKTGFTLLRIVAGFVLGIVLGIALAVVSALSETAHALITPLVRIIRATPVASFIILVMLWVGYSVVPVIIGAMIVMPVIYQNVYHGIESTDASLLEYAGVYGLNRFKTVTDIYYPSVKPFLISSAVTSMGLAWKSGVAAEVLARPAKAIGSEIYFSKIYIETADLFAWTVVVVILSLILEKLITRIINGKKIASVSSRKNHLRHASDKTESDINALLSAFSKHRSEAPAGPISLENLTVSFGEQTVLNHLNLSFDSKITCLMGESGCGKTTLLRTLSGLCPEDSGSIVNKPSSPAILFQEDRLLPWFTVERNLDSDPIALYYLERLGLEDAIDKYPSELSGGMSRRVAIARALAFAVRKGDVLLLDEPFKGLDSAMVQITADVITELPIRIIVTTHDIHDAELLGAEIIKI